MRRLARHVAANRAIWALYALAALWIGWFAVHVHVYFVMPDEVRYVKQAEVIWTHFRPLVPGDAQFATWSELQPMLMAPLWGIFDTATAYRLTHVLNALVLASAVFPAYLLGRQVLRSHRWALAGAALSIVVPWSVMAGVMMTENAAYPVAIWALWAIHRATVRPGHANDALALGLLALAFFARTELLVLAPALPVALLLQELRYPPDAGVGPSRGRLVAVLRRHPLVFGLTAAVALVLAASVTVILGDAPRNGPFRAGGPALAAETFAYVAIGVAMVPVALSAAWIAATLVRPLDRTRHAYALVLLCSGTLLTIVSAGGAVAFTNGVNDRYLAYLAPPLMIGMLAFLTERRPLALATIAAGAGTAWIAWNSTLEEVGQTFVSPTAAWHKVLYGRAPEIGRLFGAYDLSSQRLMAWSCGLACLAIALARRRARPALVAVPVALLVGAYCLAETTYTRGKLREIQPAAGYANGRDWVDRTLGYGRTADVLLSGLGEPSSAQAVWWDLAFWNSQVRGEHRMAGGPLYRDQTFPQGFWVDPRTGRAHGLDDAHYIVQGVADRRFGFRDTAPVGAPVGNLQITSLPAPVEARWAHYGPDETGFLPPGASSTLRIFGDGTAGPHTVTVTFGPPFGAKHAVAWEIRRAGRRLAAGHVRVGAAATPAIALALPARGFRDLTLHAPKAAGSPGLQFYGASTAVTAPQ